METSPGEVIVEGVMVNGTIINTCPGVSGSIIRVGTNIIYVEHGLSASFRGLNLTSK